MTVIDEVTEADDEEKPVAVKVEGVENGEQKTSEEEEHNNIDLTDPDTEMVSEDELPAENSSKEPLDTEAVSDEELPTASADLPETEAVSEDELPPESSEKKKKQKETADVDKDKEVESTTVTSTTVENGKGVKRKLSEGDDANAADTDAATKKEEAPAKKIATDKTTAKQPVKTSKLPELDKYWKAVKDDSSDFTGWTYLLQYVDQENDIDAAREAYDAFLSHYPYCYGYWRKYADYEKRKGNKKKSEEVFERGLKAIPLSVDLWIHYLNYCKATYPLEEDFIRAQFQKALDACGLEFRSDRLWESFIKWEAEGKHVHNVTQLYDKLLAIPTQAYTTHFDSFVEHVSNNQPSKVLGVDEFLTLRGEVLQVLKQYDTPISTTGTSEGPPGDDDAPPGEESAEADAKKADEETTALRERIIAIRRKVHKNTVVAVAARFPFEEGIKRPYFHVKPLERCQLKNWKDYLDYEIEQGDKDRIVTLFERCLIACALYEEFWIRYLRYLEERAPELKEKISDVYERACTIHHKKKPYLHLYWAVWEESQGNIPKAREILANLDKNIPGSMQVAYRRINLERRAACYEECANLYEHFIANSKSRLITNNLVIKYARFCWKSLNNIDRAVSILKKALEKDLENPRLYLQLIDMAMQRSPVVESEVLEVIDQFISLEGADMEQILMFAQRKVEFLEDFGSDIKRLQKASEEFRRYLKQVKEKKKRLSEIETKTTTKTDDVPTKKGKTTSDSSPATTTVSGAGGAAAAGGVGGASTGGGTYPPYSNPPPTAGGAYGQQGGGYGASVQPPYGQQQPPYGASYNQSGDPNYYQNWNYSQPNYSYSNQGWGNYYNY
ncbi:hypothetical protein LSTR_LSTR009101 [Laodelphax striatellus]|uniref:Pre-mRNA-processing factor 39 n=1 Tax=Laodelphax striatellus TaxID=195883 RepID=A0A482XN46_LAOST|nr:hypothetical protein LSTR_LSTR009101 [Laodelphax striatellus]